MVLVINRLLFLIIFSFFCLSSFGQNFSTISLSDALLEVAAQHKISLVFNPNKVSDIQVKLPPENWTLNKKIAALLENTKLQFEIKYDQIFLYQEHQIFGYIEDGDSGERLIGATIYLPQNGTYDVTNEYGFFSINTIADSIKIKVSYLGFSDLEKTINENEMDRPIAFSLSQENQIEEIIISDALVNNDDRKFIELNKGSDILLYANQASSAVGGEPDIFQAMIRQSGINTGADGTGGIHVRGGKNDQNQILYDGVRLYNSSHAFGVYSIINNSIVDQARLYKTGASGSLSGRLSSIMDVRIKNPDLRNYKANIQISTIASQSTINIPIWKDKIGILASGRRTHLDPYIKSLSRNKKLEDQITGESNFFFNDFNLKIYGKINDRQRIFLSLYGANDRYDDQFVDNYFENDQLDYTNNEKFSLDWTNKLASLRYNILLGSKSFANIQMSSYQFSYDNKYVTNSGDFLTSNFPIYYRYLIDFTSGIKSNELRVDLQTHFENHEVMYGFILSQKEYLAGTLTLEDLPYELDTSIPIPTNFPLIDIPIGNFEAMDFTGYISDKFRINKNLLIDGGVYVNYYKSRDNIYEDFDGKYLSIYGYLKSTILVNNRFSIGGSIGTYIQNEHLLTSNDNGYPSDIWLPSTYSTPPERSYQGELFAEYKHLGHTLKSSFYYKIQNGLVVYDTLPILPSVTILQSDVWEAQTFLADTESLGFEFEYSYKLNDKLSFRSVYTYGFSNYVFEDEHGQFGYPFDYSIPHSISLGFNIKITERIRFMADWYFASGKPYTLYSTDKAYSPIEKDSDVGVEIQSYYNELRLPSTHKLSIAFSTYWHWGNIRSDLNLGIQNVYNRKNVLYRYTYFNEEVRDQHGFPLIPMVRWRVSI